MTNQQQTGIAILRVTLGIALLAHGLLKIMVFTPAGTAGFFDSIGIPGVLAYPVIAGEVLGGLALIIGFKTRYAAAAAVPILAGATYAHLGAGWIFSNEGGGWEYPALWTFALIAQALMGPGAYAFDNRNTEASLSPATA